MKASKVSLTTRNIRSWKINLITKLLIAATAFIEIIRIIASKSGITNTIFTIANSSMHILRIATSS